LIERLLAFRSLASKQVVNSWWL